MLENYEEKQKLPKGMFKRTPEKIKKGFSAKEA